MTLLETLIFVAVVAIVACFTMRIVADARLMRVNARDRAAMALIAQSEIERVRQLPAAQLAEGSSKRADRLWPEGVAATVSLKALEGGLWQIDAHVEGESAEGKPAVHLTTIRDGGAP